SARLYADAFAADPSLAEEPERDRRYNAARVAALAGGGLGRDAKNLSDDDLAHWRDQARQWLGAELTAWGKRLAADLGAKELAHKTLTRWQADPDLTGLREPDALAKLSAGEREAY